MNEYHVAVEDTEKLEIDVGEASHYPLHISIEDFVLYVEDVGEAGDFVLHLESPDGSATYTSEQLLTSLPPELGTAIIKAVGVLRRMYPDDHRPHEEKV